VKLSFRKVFFYSILILWVFLSRLGSLSTIWDVQAKGDSSSSYSGSGADAYAQGSIATATPASTLTPTAGVQVEPTHIFTPAPLAVTATPLPALYAFLQAPQGHLTNPYVNLIGFESGSFSTTLQITGIVNETGFTCSGSPCELPLPPGNSRIIFKTVSPTGASSDSVIASVQVDEKSDGYYVTIESVSEYFGSFSDVCLKLWGVTNYDNPSWAQFPQFPYELNTDITLHHLAARLIVSGLVNTQNCPAGGLSQDLDWPNGCGLTQATPKMIEWQNQYDDAIWSAGNEIGIPPKILKTLIEVESQFWPGNERFYVDEYGLGQINQLGVDVLLRNDPNLYQQACSSVLSNCLMPYTSLAPDQQAQVRGALLSSQNALCSTCTNGIDLTKAKQSITFVAQLLKANCQEVKTILDKYGETTDYENYWKFTLFTYHSGISCFENAVIAVRRNDQPMDWTHLSNQTVCSDGEKYVNGFWQNLLLFDSYRFIPGASQIALYSPVFLPTNTPQPTPTTAISKAIISIVVFIDSNGDGVPQPSELVNGVPVQVNIAGAPALSGVTSGGQVRFDLSGYPVGTQVVIRLPGLYRSSTIYLPPQGTVPVMFMFAKPTLPNSLP
jgi:hypothetical protein